MSGEKPVIVCFDRGARAIKGCHVTGEGKYVRVEDSSGAYSFDSGMHIRSSKEVVFGEEARRLSFEDPDNFVGDLKAQCGTGKSYHTLSVVDLIQRDLETRLLKAFQDQFGVRPTHAVLTTPCCATDRHIADLVTAHQRAGLVVVGTIPEPSAAALAAAAGGVIKAAVGQRIAVVDTGHYSTDVAVLTAAENSVFPVLRADGLANHGGEKLMDMLSDYVLGQVAKNTGVKVSRAELSAEQRYTHMQEIAKAMRAISARPSVTVAVPLNKKVWPIEVKTATFKDLVDLFLRPVVEMLNKVIAAAGGDPKAVVQVLVSGGLAQNGLIRERLAALTGMLVTRVPDPVDACANGGAIQCQAMVRQSVPGAVQELPPAPAQAVLCTTHTIASVTVDRGLDGERTKVCSLLVGEGEKIPLKQHRDYPLIRADQPSVLIQIVRGKEGQSPEQCMKFAELLLENLPPEKTKTSRIRVECSVSEANLASVTVTDLVSKVSKTVSFQIGKEAA